MKGTKVKNVFDKTKNEMKRIEKNLSQIEVRMHDTIYELGRWFYTENQDKSDENAACQEWMDALRQLEAEKKELYKDKLKLQGLMQCEHCNSIIAYGSAFCNQCGKQVEGGTEA